MTPSLPELLRRLSTLMPGGRVRVQIRPGSAGIPRVEELSLVIAGRLGRVAYLQDNGFMETNPGNSWELALNLMQVEYALREEIEARGWAYALDARPHREHPAYCCVIYTPKFHSAHGLSPDHALAAALVSTLEAL